MKQNELLLAKKFVSFPLDWTNFSLFWWLEWPNWKNFIISWRRMWQSWRRQCHNVSRKDGPKTRVPEQGFSGEFVRVDLERMYEHQERNVKTLTDRVDSTIETKLQHSTWNAAIKFHRTECFFSSSAISVETDGTTARTSSNGVEQANAGTNSGQCWSN